MPPTPRPVTTPPLASPVLLILLSLATGDAHGYRLRADVRDRSQGRVDLDPGSLYRLLARLLDEEAIKEVDAAAGDAERRRCYRLTPRGRRVLHDEIDRLEHLVVSARAIAPRARRA